MALTTQLVAIVLVSLLARVNAGVSRGALEITVDGQKETVYPLGGGNIQVQGSTLSLIGGARIYLGKEPAEAYGPDVFYAMPLLGKYFKLL